MDTINARLKVKTDTTANWTAVAGSFIPLAGEVIVYSDYFSDDGTGTSAVIPGIKIGTGNSYIGDLPFVDTYTRNKILAHISDSSVHVTSSEKQFWSDKVNIDDAYALVNQELQNETLVFTRL